MIDQSIGRVLRSVIRKPILMYYEANKEMCSCGDRLKTECPGEWEPGCDLGNNETYAVAVPIDPLSCPITNDPVEWALFWLNSALRCEDFHWDADQKDAANVSLQDALIFISKKKEELVWECKPGGLKKLTQRQYEKQTDKIKRHYTKIEHEFDKLVKAVREAGMTVVKTSDGYQLIKIDAIVAQNKCDLPPDGWPCTREAGHPGPCAAYHATTRDIRFGTDQQRMELLKNSMKNFNTNSANQIKLDK